MKNLLLYTAIVIGSSIYAAASASPLAINANLSINDAILGGNYGDTVVGGSFFAVDLYDWVFPDEAKTGITGVNGLNVNSTQAAGTIDNTGTFFGSSASHSTLSETTILGQTDNGGVGDTATLDFSGWTLNWSGAIINMGTGPSNGIATVVCEYDCSVGDLYSLDYYAIFPHDGTTNIGGLGYWLHLEGTIGTISAVPIPAAAWLFLSGMLGLAGVLRIKRITP